MTDRDHSITATAERIFDLRKRRDSGRCANMNCNNVSELKLGTFWLCQRCWRNACLVFNRGQEKRNGTATD